MRATMAYTVMWYGREGLLDKTPFETERDAKEYAIAMFPAKKQSFGVVAVEVRKDNGEVVYSHAES
jgi:hypothetical protein